jgi:hypothetical protein
VAACWRFFEVFKTVADGVRATGIKANAELALGGENGGVSGLDGSILIKGGDTKETLHRTPYGSQFS